MKKLIALFSIVVFSIATIMATGPIQKAHNEAKDNKGKPGGKTMNCAYCHGDKSKDPKTWPKGVMTTKKDQLKGYKKGEAKFGELKNNPLCKDCHK